MKDQSKAYFYAILAVLFWSTMSSAFKLTLRYTDPLSLLLYASFFSIVVLFVILLSQNKIKLLRITSRWELFNSALLGLMNPFLYYVVLFKAYDLLMAQEAGTLNYIWPIVLVLLSIPILKQKISFLSFIAILISFSGIVVISTHGQVLSMTFSNPLGVGLAVSSAVFWALFFIYNLKDKRDEVVKVFLNMCFGFLYILILKLFIGGLEKPDGHALLGSLYIGVFEMGISFVFWLKALKYSTTTAKVSNLIYLSPFIALIIIRFAVGEEILLSTIAGLVLIVSGIILQKYTDRIQLPK